LKNKSDGARFLEFLKERGVSVSFIDYISTKFVNVEFTVCKVSVIDKIDVKSLWHNLRDFMIWLAIHNDP
jgi:hypothetical protein